MREQVTRPINFSNQTHMEIRSVSTQQPVHPGAIIKHEISRREMLQSELARIIDMSPSILSEIINEHRPLNEKSAMLMEAALGLDAEKLLQIQTKFNLFTIKQSKPFMDRVDKASRMSEMWHK